MTYKLGIGQYLQTCCFEVGVIVSDVHLDMEFRDGRLIIQRVEWLTGERKRGI